jgi:Cd2+/Zn2+-exporting ATPase
LISSFFLRLQLGEEHIIPIIGYAASIVIGGYSLFIKGLKRLMNETKDEES